MFGPTLRRSAKPAPGTEKAVACHPPHIPAKNYWSPIAPERCCSRSENVLQSELQLAHVVSGPAYETRSGHKVANLPKVGRRCRAAAAPVHVRTCPRGMVQDVERFKAELKA